MFSGYFGFVAEPLELFTQDGIPPRAQHRAGLIHRAVVPGAPSILAPDRAGLRGASIGVTEVLGKPGMIRDHRMGMALRLGGAGLGTELGREGGGRTGETMWDVGKSK